MKTKLIFFCLVFICIAELYSYGIQQVSITFIDPDRNNRQIPTQIFIPVENESQQREGQDFPFIVFGHGWIQSYTTYQAIWEELVPSGWIMAFPTTEGSLFPSHQQFALDLAFLSFAIPQASENPSSPLFNLVKPTGVAMGHSMGGGASVLATSGNNNFAALASLAAANTNPSAINAAVNVTIPSLTFSGSSDSIAPPSSHQIPIYNNLASIYKSFISLLGVSHTGINSNAIMFDLLGVWLEFINNNDFDFLVDFENLLESYHTAGGINYNIVNYYPPQNLNIEINEQLLILSWDKALGEASYIVEASVDLAAGFHDLSSGQGEFSEMGNTVYWTIPADAEIVRMFFRIRIIR